ncbi:Retrovirus-related Pol polyprotein LINE-1 [Gossypium australe]|uniref:Retrovirus-related Pol polyprotein LINE-1 n=1 Tax=Gossypium australe TaxID=47621 RepID=A0A5B6VEH9_9ROSI|nr:Retrovirus-related Pol polyprotein LINE-1 [Gossypium australe]
MRNGVGGAEEIDAHYLGILWNQLSFMILVLGNAKCDWLQLGDLNTKFFHRRTLHRRKMNKIYDENELEYAAVNLFQKIYGEHPGPMKGLPSISFPKLDNKDV